MAKKIDYKHQLERLDEILSSFFVDKTLGNAFTEFVKMALEGKL